VGEAGIRAEYIDHELAALKKILSHPAFSGY
jgi:hypothetical protein